MPVVTISRLFGSGGGEVASRVAAALGWPLLDNNVVDAVAERLGVPSVEVSALEERVPSIVERLARTLTLASPEILPAADAARPLDEEEVVAMTERVIDEATEQGPCVVVGRGTQCLLAARADALHVLCHAPHAALVRRVSERLQLAPAEAERRVIEVNRQREQFVRRHWRRDWLSPRNYHLCLDTEWLGVEAAAELVVELARERLVER